MNVASDSLVWAFVPLAYLAVVSVPLAVTDARSGRLPNALVLPGLMLTAWALVGVGLHDPPLALGAAGAAAAVGALTAVLWAVGALGMGDVKLTLLLAVVAGLLGGAETRVLEWVGLAVALLTAAGLTVGLLTGGRAPIPLGPALLAGFWLGLAASVLSP